MTQPPLRVLVAHNSYQFKGGEDTVVEAEIALLREHGHEVRIYARHNDELQSMGRLEAAVSTLWSRGTSSDIHRFAEQWRPNVIHVHNTLPLISPSIYWAAHDLKIPLVQTLHNFRLMCVQAMFLRDQKVCEDCMGTLPWRGVVRRCYRDSALQSAALCAMLGVHRAIGTYQYKIARYIALNEFCRGKFIEGGLPAEKLMVKPNFVADPGWVDRPRSAHFLFVGRLSIEKGVATLADAMRRSNAQPSLHVAGTGPQQDLLQAAPGTVLLGALDSRAVFDAMSQARALVLPSIWYENFPRTLVEAFACGTPVIASRIGALAELVRDGETGLLFEPGCAEDLANKLSWAQHHPEHMAEMGRHARRQYLDEFSAEINYQKLMTIYSAALAQSRTFMPKP